MAKNLSDIEMAQDRLEEYFNSKIDELQSQLQSAEPPASAKGTVAKVSDELRTFKEIMYCMVKLLRREIGEWAQQTDSVATWQRRKALIFLGVAESDKEDCTAKILDITNKKMGLADITASSISECHRLGARSSDRPRPILIRLENFSIRSALWRAKTKLKGSGVAVREFLTKTRQAIFTKAKQHFGMRSCWTQDGTIVVKAVDGSRHKIITVEELKSLMARFPVAAGHPPSAARNVVGATGTAGSNVHARKN